MKCKNCGVDLVRGFSFCMECGLPVPPEALEESGLPQRNIDSGVQEAFGGENGGAPSAGSEYARPEQSAHSAQPVREEEITELKPVLQGGSDFTQGEALKPKLQGGSDYTQGKALKPQYIGGLTDEDAGEALKAKYVGGNTDDDGAGKGADVKAVLREGSADENSDTEKLTFCPNCGMHMQKSSSRCEICGMALGNKPSVPKTSSGIPLFNTESDSFVGFGGFEGFGGLSDEDAARIDSFVNPDPFGDTAIGAQATPEDFAQLTQQLASFSAGTPTLEVTQNTVVRQQSTPQGEDFQLNDFQLSDDLSDVAIPIYDNGVRVISDFSLEEDPNETIPDPFAFLQTSLDEPSPMPVAEPTPKPEPRLEPIQKAEPEPVQEPAPVQETAPVREPAHEPMPIIEETPFIEETPVITETPATKPNTAVLTDIGAPTTPPKAVEAPKTEQPNPTAQSAPTAPSAPTAHETPQAPSEPKAPVAPATQPKAPEAENDTQHAPEIPPNMKKCPVCGRIMPNEDMYCPGCGRSMFGPQGPNNKPTPKKRSVTFLIVLFVVIIVAVAVFFFVKQSGASASEIPTDEYLQFFYSE